MNELEVAGEVFVTLGHMYTKNILCRVSEVQVELDMLYFIWCPTAYMSY